MMNNWKTGVLLAALTALFLAVGAALGGRGGLLLALIFAGVMNFTAYWYSDKLVLKIYRAKAIDPNHSSGLYQIVADLARRGQLPMPKVYMIESDAPNAFATGRNPEHASVAATSGIMQMLTREELTGVMAHELSHVRHRDTLISTVSATIAGAISALANFFMWTSLFLGGRREGGGNVIVALLMMILAPMAAALIQMAISRSREFAADEAGARLCGNSEWLASALEKLEYYKTQKVFPDAESHPATAHLFIINPLHGRSMARLFSTHPATKERVQRLRALRLR